MFKKVLVFIIISLFMFPIIAKADGVIMPPVDYWIYETGQKAAIYFENNTETLVLSTSFQGNAKDFAYIVSTPNKPEVSKVSSDIFQNLENLTIPYGNNYEITPMLGATGVSSSLDKASVTVVEEKKVGMFDIKVLSADDATALYKWLKDNNFTYPESKKYILDDYIQNKWFFTTAKISSESITDNVQGQLSRGELSPLKFVFSSDKIVFPLKISSVLDDTNLPKDMMLYSGAEPATPAPDSPVSSSIAPYPYYSNIPITLYIFADHKKEIPNFYVNYANWFNKKEIEKIAKDDNGNAWIKSKNKMFLTKLTTNMSYSQMTSDLFPDNADNNTTVGVPNWWEGKMGDYTGMALFICYIILIKLFFILVYFQVTKRNKTVYMISWIVQIFSFLVVLAPIILMIFMLFYTTGIWGGVGISSYRTIQEWITLALLSTFVVAIPMIMFVILLIEMNLQKNYLKK